MAAERNFYHDIYDVVRLIPRGRVTSYGAIAAYLGSAKASRQVGWAMNVSHGIQPPIPAHRVVNRVGLLSGKAHFGNGDEMQSRLEKEGIRVKDNQVENFKECFWDPRIELEL